MPTGPKPPTLRQLQDIADGFGIELTGEEAQEYQSLMVGTMESYRRVEAYPEQRPPVKYPCEYGGRGPSHCVGQDVKRWPNSKPCVRA